MPPMKAFRWVLSATLAAALGWQGQSAATVVQAIPLGELVSMSEWVVFATVKSSRSHFETIGGSRRMVTDTLIQIDRAVTPNRASTNFETGTLTVRTLGGTVGEVAQVVLGEAVLPSGTQQLLFLDEGRDSTFRVSAMAQGQYPVTHDDEGQPILQRSPGLDVVVNLEQSAVTALAGRSVEQAQALVENVRRIP